LQNTDCIHCYEAYAVKYVLYYRFHDDDDDNDDDDNDGVDDDDAVCVMTGP